MSPPRIGDDSGVAVTKDFSNVIKSKRFDVLEELGHGEWGTVYKVFDHKQVREWAIKKTTPSEIAKAQMAHRGLKLEEIAARDARGPIASRNVAPGFLYTDDEGTDFVLLDIYDKSFEEVAKDKKDHLEWHNNRKRNKISFNSNDEVDTPKTLKSGFTINEVIDYMKQLTVGLDEFYTGLVKADEYKRKRLEEIKWKEWIDSGRMKVYGVDYNDSLIMSHGDLKFDNYMVTPVNAKHTALRLLIADKGTATCVSQLSGKAPRDNIGAVNIRAPEQYKPDNHPDQRSDIWQLGCNMYRLLTGNYPFEKEIAANPNFMIETDRESLDKLITKKKKNIPRIFRKLNRKMLSVSSYDRPTLEEVSKSLSEIEKKTNTGEYISEAFWRHAGKIVGGLGLVALITWGYATRQATDMKIPDRLNTPTIYIDAEKSGRPVVFFKEDMKHKSDVISPYDVPTMVFHVGDADNFTKNYCVARLYELYDYALRHDGLVFGPNSPTNAQYAIWNANRLPGGSIGEYPEPRVAAVVKSIEYALSKATPSKYKMSPASSEAVTHDTAYVDVEDFAVISRLGDEKLRDAKDLSGSSQYGKYIDAKYANGTYVVDRDEKKFLETFISLINGAGRYLRIAQEPDSSRSE